MTTTVLNKIIGEVENKLPTVCGLVKKTVYKAKISDIEVGKIAYYFLLS